MNTDTDTDTRYEAERVVESQALRLADAKTDEERSRALNDLYNAIEAAKAAGVSTEAIDGILDSVDNADDPEIEGLEDLVR